MMSLSESGTAPEFHLDMPGEEEEEKLDPEFEWSEPTTELSICEDGAVGEVLLIVEVVSAQGLPSMDVMTQRADPFCLLKFGTRVLRSSIKKKTRSPVWKEEFRILVSETELNYDLIIEVWDYDRFSKNDIIGRTRLHIDHLKSLPSSPLHPFALPILRPEPRLPRVRFQRDGGVLYVNASLVSRDEAEQLFWDKFLDLGLMYEQDKTPLSPKRKENQLYSPSNPEMKSNEFDALFSDPLLIWQVYLCVKRGESMGKLIQEVLTSARSKDRQNFSDIVSESVEDKTLRKHIIVQARGGKLEIEHVQPIIKQCLRLLYANRTGRVVTSKKKLQQFLQRLTIKKGMDYENPNSVKYIQPFIQRYHIDMSEFEVPEEGFEHFNAFFYRRLIPGARQISAEGDPTVAVSPADCRVLVFPEFSQAKEIWIKGENFSLLKLLGSEELAAHYDGGSLVIARLAPQDYHRFHSPVSGTIGQFVEMDGAYHPVNPIAVKHPIDIFTTNRRVYTLIHSAEFGMVCFVAIGAALVGSIRFTVSPGDFVEKGDELGYFAFGGSTVLILYESGEISFDPDLLHNSVKPLETRIRMGDHIGVSTV